MKRRDFLGSLGLVAAAPLATVLAKDKPERTFEQKVLENKTVLREGKLVVYDDDGVTVLTEIKTESKPSLPSRSSHRMAETWGLPTGFITINGLKDGVRVWIGDANRTYINTCVGQVAQFEVPLNVDLIMRVRGSYQHGGEKVWICSTEMQFRVPDSGTALNLQLVDDSYSNNPIDLEPENEWEKKYKDKLRRHAIEQACQDTNAYNPTLFERLLTDISTDDIPKKMREMQQDVEHYGSLFKSNVFGAPGVPSPQALELEEFRRFFNAKA